MYITNKSILLEALTKDNKIVSKKKETNIFELGTVKVKPTNISSSSFACECKTIPKYEGVCLKCPRIVHILDNYMPGDIEDQTAKRTVPKNLLEVKPLSIKQESNEKAVEEGVFALVCIPEGVDFGPYLGIESVNITTGRAWLLDKKAELASAGQADRLNWMLYVRYTSNIQKHNLMAFQYGGNVYYRSERQIEVGEELIVNLKHNITNLDVTNLYYYQPVWMERVHKVYACTYCCLGYGSREDLLCHVAKNGCGDNGNEKAVEEGVFALVCIPEGVDFGPYLGIESVNITTGRAWLLDKRAEFANAGQTDRFNWMPYVRYTRNVQKHNLMAFQYGGNVYYRSERQIEVGEELIVNLKHNITNLDVTNLYYYQPVWMERVHKVYACTYCCLGYGSREDLLCHVVKNCCGDNEEDLNDIIDCRKCGMFVYGNYALTIHETICPQKPTENREEILKVSASKISDWAKSPLHPSADQKPFKCQFCGQAFSDQIEHGKHVFLHTGAKLFKCNHCGEEFARYAHFRRHIHMHANQNPFKCQQCGKDFRSTKQLRLHLPTHSVGDTTVETDRNSIKCELCGRKFKDKYQLKRHGIVHTSSRPYACNYCGKTFRQPANVEKHILLHTRERPFECRQCGNEFSCRLHLRRHILLIHADETPHVCQICGIGFNDKNTLNYHICSSAVEKVFKCLECGKEFSDRSDFRRHAFLHIGTKPFTCDYCNKSFVRVGCLKKHMSIHTGEEPFKCRQCDKTFKDKTLLNRHVLVQCMEKYFACKHCDKRFIKKRTLTQHNLIHTPGVLPFKCQHCNKGFSNKSSLNVHIRLHTGEKSFKCNYCEKTYRSRYLLNRHAIIHSNRRPFKCHHCGRGFACKGDLKTHISSHAVKKPYICNICGKRFTAKSKLNYHISVHNSEKPFKCEYCGKRFKHEGFLIRHNLICTKFRV